MTTNTFRLSCIEQMVMNPDYAGLRSFRVEVWGDGAYADNELSFLVPEEMFDAPYDAMDGKDVDARCVFGKPLEGR